MPSVRTEVTPGKGYEVMAVAPDDLPVIGYPIILPAPEPGRYKNDSRPRNFRRSMRWYRQQIELHGFKEAWPWIKRSAQADMKHHVFLFKIRHGIIENDRAWLFKK